MNTPQSPTQLNTAHTALLLALKNAGVTDVAADTSFNWMTTPAKLTPQPIQKQKTFSSPTTSSTIQLGKKLTPKPASIKKSNINTDVKTPSAKQAVWLTGTPESLLIITGATFPKKDDTPPFTENEITLLTNMLTAINIDISKTGFLACAVADEFDTPYPNEFKQQLIPVVQKLLKETSPPAILALGQVAAWMISGKKQNLLNSQEEAAAGSFIENKNIAASVTYHPRTLLKQPLLKKQAWQDLLTLQEFLEENK